MLAEAGAVLTASLDFDVTLRRVAGLAVPGLADMCVVDLLRRDGSIRDGAVAAADPTVAAELEQLRRASPIDPDGLHPVARALREREPVLLERMTDEHLASFATSAEHERF